MKEALKNILVALGFLVLCTGISFGIVFGIFYECNQKIPEPETLEIDSLNFEIYLFTEFGEYDIFLMNYNYRLGLFHLELAILLDVNNSLYYTGFAESTCLTENGERYRAVDFEFKLYDEGLYYSNTTLYIVQLELIFDLPEPSKLAIGFAIYYSIDD
ncbi:MAG: hypothetical protein KAU62_10635 [Candidatus Heimdallarchaeota archaeon]|nr:hypothetical protein [Candidatus Heimdallarchaeota archaeon]MCK4611601.1 hypothetical protein [Candidatus Heimdallarchaeota archaeon]